MKNKAVNALIKMNMPANIKGFHYIAEAMGLFEMDELWSAKIYRVYVKLSMMYDTTPSAVERAIRNAFAIVMKKGNPEVVKTYLPLNCTGNGNLLNTFYLKLSQE